MKEKFQGGKEKISRQFQAYMIPVKNRESFTRDSRVEIVTYVEGVLKVPRLVYVSEVQSG